jgi:hypothetical protein
MSKKPTSGNTTVTIGNSYGTTVVGHGNSVSVSAAFANTGTMISHVESTELKTALTSLEQLIRQLVQRFPDDADKQAIANKAEAMTKEAIAPKPDKSMLKVTGRGLVEAAKTMADLAAPIATAVAAVLSLLGASL